MGIALIATAALASAGSVTLTQVFGPTSTDYTHTFTLPQFDPGTDGIPLDAILSGVSLGMGASLDVTSLDMKNTGGVEEDAFYASAGSKIITLDNSASSDEVPNILLDLFDVGPVTLGPFGSGACPPSTPGPTCNIVTYPAPGVVAGSDSKTVPEADWSGYEGVGNFTIDGKTMAQSTFSGGGGNISFDQTTTATLTASVTYDYTESGTPEPATIFLFGSALTGLVLLRRKRFAR
jgi:hypothetical protein